MLKLQLNNQKGFSAVFIILGLLLLAIPLGIYLVSNPTFFNPRASSGGITNITDNRNSYPGGQIPEHEKFEVSFNVATQAQNLQMPYDGSPPAGVPAGMGITVNAQFSPDNFQTVYTQPAFYFQDFDYQIKDGQDWIYPKDSYSWKARFAPNKEGDWQYRITTQDKDGAGLSAPQTFTVAANPGNHGFLKVSPKDSRYFEFEDGTYFPGLGYNYALEWEDNPIQANKLKFEEDKQKGVQLLRGWLSQGGFYSGDHNPWRSASQGSEGDSLLSEKAYPGHDVAWWLDSSNPILFIGWLKKDPAVKPNTKYKLSLRYNLPDNLGGSGNYGVAVKKGSSWGQKPCDSSPIVTPFANISTGNNWQILESNITTGNENFLGFLCVELVNVSSGKVYIDQIDLREDLGGGNLGVNIINRPSAALHMNMDQLRSYTFDKILESAQQNDVYLKLVGLEKNDWIFNHIDSSGKMTVNGGNDNFYGSQRNFTKTRWLQQAWWRYMQARWGYSTNIHSWELLNEGDPFNGNHYALADEFAKYMHSFGPNSHLVTTSTWHSFPEAPFWTNRDFGNLDYGDVHQYVYKDQDINVRIDKESTGQSVNVGNPNDWFDPVVAVNKISQALGAKGSYGIGKPVMRGETGFIRDDSNGATNEIQQDNQGIWLHKYIWAGINSGGVIESYWFSKEHINPSPAKDLRGEYGKYYNFIKNIPLSNGNYVDSDATVSGGILRVMGQKDTVNRRAHLWIDNKTNTWGNVVSGVQPTAVTSATVTVPGMPQGIYPVLWYNTGNQSTVKTENVSVDGSGNLMLNIPQSLSTDIAVKIGDYLVQTVSAQTPPAVSPSPVLSPSPSLLPSPSSASTNINLVQISVFLSEYGRIGSGITSDLNTDGKVDIFDYAVLLGRIMAPVPSMPIPTVSPLPSSSPISSPTPIPSPSPAAVPSPSPSAHASAATVITPSITNAGLNTDYNPWAVWFLGEHITPELKVRIFDQGNQWGHDTQIVYGDPNSGTFQLPSNSAPSGCNSTSSCDIQIQLINGNFVSNNFTLNIPSSH